MKLQWLIKLSAIALLVAVAFLGLAGHDSIVTAQDEGSKIEGLLLDQFSAESSADFIVRFSEQADLSAAFSMDWDARGDFVYNTLVDTAAKSQVNAKAILDVSGLTYQTFIAGNDLYVWAGTLTDANALAELPEVYYIRATRTYYIDPFVVTKPMENISWSGDLLANNALTTVADSPTATTDWGITDTQADQAWSLSARGQGIKVANIDTGVQWNHPALINQFACPGDPTNAACWSDPSNVCGVAGTCDNNGHGTHTMGTMVAKDNPSLTYIVGMAPDATWIACKGCESTSCSDTALNACADWILAPGGSAANRPNVVNNSWGGGGGDDWYQAKVQAWVAAGIFPAFSAGNSAGCNSLGSPGDYPESFSTTGHDVDRNHAYAEGSSIFGDTPYTKPNISAPAVSICSTIPGSSWNCSYSGTSMASPHSAGAVAQIWSVCPAYKGNVDLTFQLLQSWADAPTPPNPTCGVPASGEGTYEDGYGYLNVNEAVLNCVTGVPLGTLQGHVYDQDSNPVAGASVSAEPASEANGINATTDPDGFYSMERLPGTYDVTASKLNYTSQTVNDIVITADQTTVQNFVITYEGAWTEIPQPTGCPALTRWDGEWYPATGLVYLLGGRYDAATDGNIYAFNPDTGSCADTGADMEYPISNYTVNLVNNGSADVLCTFGGRGSAGASILNVQCYNPMTNIATTVANLPAAYAGYTPGAQVVVDNLVYIFGGFNSLSAPYEIARTDRFDPTLNTFTQIGNLSLARAYLDATVLDGKIYAFGGTVFDGVNLISQTRAEVMADPGGAGTWDDAAVLDLPTATAEGRVFGFNTNTDYVLAGKIIIAGGGVWPGETADVFAYDVAANTYDYTFADLNQARRDHAGFTIPGDPAVMWVYGGRQGVDAGPYMPPEYYEVNFLAPKIIVTPLSLETPLFPDDTATLPITIENHGDAPLDWGITEVGGMKINKVSPPAEPDVVQNPNLLSSGEKPVTSNVTDPEIAVPYNGPLAVLYDQTDNPGTNGFPSQDFETGYNAYDNQGADDFIVPDGVWLIQSVYVAGSTSIPGSVISSVNVYFYEDNAGLPGAAVYTALGIDAIDDGTANLTIALTSPAILPAGTYWVSVQAILDFDPYGQYFWSTRAIQTNHAYAWMNPGGGFGLGCTSWGYGASVCGVGGGVEPDTLFRLEGTAFSDVPWLDENPTSGTIQPGGSMVVNVTFDSNGLTTGEYLADLEIYSNDPNTSPVVVPVTMTVESADLGITKTDSLDPIILGEDLTYTINVTNDGQDATGVVVVDTLPAGVTFVSASAGCSHAAGKVTCAAGDIPDGDFAQITIVVTVEVEGLITNTATVVGNELDPVLANNTATQATTVIATRYFYLPLVRK